MRRVQVSDQVWEHEPIVRELRQRLGDNLRNTTRQVQSGQLKADATESVDNMGFSLRVKRRDGFGPDVSIMAIRNGEFLIFPTRQKLNRCLPCHDMAIRTYLSLVSSIEWGEALIVDAGGDNATPFIRLDGHARNVLIDVMGQFSSCAQDLANDPP